MCQNLGWSDDGVQTLHPFVLCLLKLSVFGISGSQMNCLMTHVSISGYGAAANLDLFHKLSF